MNTKVGDSHVKIPDNFFKGMKKLKVLDLNGMQFSSLQSSLGLLINLQTLCLDYSKFEDVAIIGDLKELKILSLRGSSVEQLPKEIGQLTQLKLLDLSDCDQLEVIAPNVLSNLVQLEELYMNGCSVLWEVEGLNVQRSNASLEELKHLFQLTTLEIDIKDDKIVPEGLFTKKLDRYNISVGAGSSMFGGSPMSFGGKFMFIRSFYKPITSIRTLKLKLKSTICSDKLQGFKNVECLCLDEMWGINNVVFDLDKEGFSQLKHLHVHNNPNVLCIADSIKCRPHDAFPALESLILFNLISLEKLCCGQPTINSFSNLKIIEVAHCVKLKNIFSSSNSRSLPHLQEIHVANCENMKEIFVAEREDNVNNNEVLERVEFCQLCYLTLTNLPRIASFYSEVKTPSTLPMRQKESTTNLQSNDNNLEDELDTFTPLFNGKVVLPNLKTLNLEAINSEMIWDNQLPIMSSCYQSLTRLIIINMEKLNYVFPSSMVKSFEQLQHLEIRSCKELKAIVGKEEGAEAAATFIFSRVEFLQLINLPKLTTFYPGIHTSSWPKLKWLEVSDCQNLHIFTSEYKVVFPNLEDVKLHAINSQMIWDSQLPIMSDCYQNLTSLVIKDIETLKYVFPSSIVKNFKQLQHFEINSCKELKEIIAKEGAEAPPTFIFPRVEFLKLENLAEFKTFYPGMHTSEWPNLKKLEVSGCDKLQMSTSEYKVVLPNLEALELHGANTENISQLLKTFSCSRKLTRLVLEKCEKIKYVFPSSMVKSFKQLQHFEISNCKELKEIFTREQGEETNVKFDFPHVAFLKLNDLPQLTTFCLGIRTIDWPWPKLKKLEVSDCDKLQMLTSENKICPNLEELELVLRADNMMTWQRLLPENFSCKCTVEINGDKSTNIPLGILQRSFDLEKLVLSCSSYKEIFSYGWDDIHTGTLMQIKSLKLYILSNLKNLWSKDSKVDFVIQNLEVLEVECCDKLSCMLPSSASFANLTVLSISWCWGLIKLFTPSTAKSMVQLKEVNIKLCRMLIEVVSNEEDVGVEDGIVFNKLKLLSLHCLESLTCFCYGNFTFKFPALEELIVEDCPNMKTFSEGDTSAPCLQKVKKSKWDKEGYWKSDLNTTMQQLYKKEVNSNLEELTLSGKDIMSMWQDQFPEPRFSKVKVVNVIQNESTNIPIEILQRCNNLQKLVVKGNSYQELFSCGEGEKHAEMLTHIKQLELGGLFNLKHMWKQDSHQVSILRNLEELLVYHCHNLINLVPSSASFENLITLAVWNCDGLVNLVTSSTAKSMVQLEDMSISDCETMVEIVANTGDVEKDEIVFSKLKSLRLLNLESLSSFCSGNHTFKFPALEDMTVGKCPKMSTFSRGVLSTPKLDKVMQNEDDNEEHWEGDLNTTIQHLFKEVVGQKLPGSSSKSA